MSACSSKRVVVEFNEHKRVQVIPVTEHVSLYAQEDMLLDKDSLDSKLYKMKPEWSEQISSVKTYDSIAYAAATLQFLSLLACITNKHQQSSLAFCGGSIASGIVGVKFSLSAEKKRGRVVDSYNNKYQ